MNGETLISASIQGGILAAMVWLIVLAMPTMPPVAKVWLWRLVFLKFALGFVGIGNIPLRVLPAEPAPAPEATMSDTVSYEPADTGVIQPPIVLAATPKREIPWNLLWLVGTATVGAYALYGIGKTARMVRCARPVEDTWLLQKLNELCLSAGVRRTPRLMESAETKTALLAWSLRPAILLPAGLVKGGSDVSVDIRLMLAHEVAHLANSDLAWNLLATGVKSVFFFHPLVWLSAGRSRAAQETAADERAVRMTGTSLKLYGEMLLRATVAVDTLRGMPGVVAVTGTVRSLRERLDAMNRFSEKPPLALRAAAFAAIVALFPGYCLVARAQEPPAVLAPQRQTTNLPVKERSAMLWKAPGKAPSASGWIRFDPATGAVTDDWHLEGSKAAPVWWRIDQATKKKVYVHGVGYWIWAQIRSGKVVATYRGPGRGVKLVTRGRLAPITPDTAPPAPAPMVAVPPQRPLGGGSLPRLAPAKASNPLGGDAHPRLAPGQSRNPFGGSNLPRLAPNGLGGGKRGPDPFHGRPTPPSPGVRDPYRSTGSAPTPTGQAGPASVPTVEGGGGNGYVSTGSAAVPTVQVGQTAVPSPGVAQTGHPTAIPATPSTGVASSVPGAPAMMPAPSVTVGVPARAAKPAVPAKPKTGKKQKKHRGKG
ncbi:MAG TPA: M56 family metallopeptidase [Fimbriimonadaceae bacterium]|nr:M56 family metallopeptidase [Fimbriimonadaceae bacterium]